MIKKKLLPLVIGLIASLSSYSQITLETPNVESKLFLGSGENQALIVALGGSEGKNAWASDYWKTTRDAFIEKGYSFLALGYFGSPGTPATLNKIAIEDVYNAISIAKNNVKINPNKIAIIGGSRGADLALLLGSYYTDISAVVALSPSHAVFPAHTETFDTSCWSYGGKELPFIPVNDASIPYLMKGDLRNTFAAMMKDTQAEQKASIQIERINGPVLLISATEDEIIPAVEMANKMAQRLRDHGFKHYFKQLTVEGKHEAATQHFREVFKFLEEHFAKK